MPYRNVRTLLKKLHIMPNQSEDGEGSTSSRGNKSSCGSSPERSSPSHHNTENKSSSGLSGWLNSVTGRQNTSPPSSSNVRKGERREPSDSVESSGFDLMSDTVLRDLERSNSRDQEMEEEYQIRLALELSAREDPEAVQIEAVKQISLGSCPSQNTPAEIIAYRYWNYNALNYDDKILDGFYDLYGIMSESTSEKMPSLVDLQRAPVSNSISWEAVLVNRAADSDLLKLEQKALVMALGLRGCDLVQKLAALVADYMGGPVGDPYNMLKAWRDLSNCLRATVGSMVLPLGSLTVGLARHRALLFKVLADSAGIPCRLVKGQQYTRSDDVAMNIVKISDGREYIVDLMADPGTLIPSDAAGPQIEFEEPLCDTSHFLRDVEGSCPASSGRGVTSSVREYSEIRTLDKRSRSGNSDNVESQLYDRVSLGDPIVPRNSRAGSSHEPVSKPFKPELESGLSDDCQNPGKVVKAPGWDFPSRHNPSHLHARSPSWTEGVSSPAVRRMKVKDVSQYMIDATKENPQLAQKLHDVLLESGVVAPPNLFTDIFPEQLDASILDARNQSQDRDGNKNRRNDIQHKGHSEASSSRVQLEHLKRVEVLDAKHLHVLGEVIGLPSSSQPKESDALTQGTSPVKFVKHASVSDAAAAARADTFASSEVVSAAKGITNLNHEVPVTAADNSTAAAVVATTAAVSRQCEQLDSCAPFPAGGPPYFDQIVCIQNDGNANDTQCELCGSGDHGHDASVVPPEAVRSSDRSRANESTKSDIVLDDVTELEIPWEEIILGERIGLGSYGEVYRGEWRGTEVAVKKFLDQDISGDALEEFICEVRIMKRIRHPNVVLFMGAVIHAPNLSIVTEFLPRGSLYRLIHRPNNQLDERRRLRMAIDVARGMNYLHNCTPVIVHRDLKSPNLLVDKNWVVKVCDFGLSRMKHSTFLSSRSTAGTAEWMAPEVLRNEPSDEKCDVYSFGVILWELSTLQQPWGGMNPMQVVGAVGFQHRRLDIPDYVDPIIADIIKKCWQTDPKMRPSFTDIMAALKPLQKPITSAQVPRPRASMSTGQEKGQSSRAT